ncbi:MAG TPA: hypothetical protein VFV65_08255 [Gemmatimonadales bacterium]|nr:hypothetical protein [Gemmatimonadales bacterium]
MQFSIMKGSTTWRGLPLLTAVVFVLGTTATAHAQGAAANQGGLSPELASARSGLEKYQDPLLAVHDGYLSTVACIDFPHDAMDGTMHFPAGGMGVHLINMQNIGPTLDPAKPQVLIYEPEGGKLKLVAAEWFVPVAIAGDKPPSIFGQTLMGPMDGHAPIMPPELRHYDLHVWLWKTNPSGMFSPTNPAVKCDARGYEVKEDGSGAAHSHGE